MKACFKDELNRFLTIDVPTGDFQCPNLYLQLSKLSPGIDNGPTSDKWRSILYLVYVTTTPTDVYVFGVDLSSIFPSFISERLFQEYLKLLRWLISPVCIVTLTEFSMFWFLLHLRVDQNRLWSAQVEPRIQNQTFSKNQRH